MAGLGLGLARGLESGLRLSMDYRDRQDTKERQARLDAEQSARQTRTDERQSDQDALSALDAQQKALLAEGTSLTEADPSKQFDLGQRLEGVQKQRMGLLGKISSRDLPGSVQAGRMDVEGIVSGKVDPTKLEPGAFTRAWVIGTGRNPVDFRRGPKGEPSKIEAASQELIEADGDPEKSIKPANELWQPELRRSIGKPSKYGGKIVDQKIIGLIPDKQNSTPEDPRFFLQTRVFIKDKDFKGPPPPGTPEGATGDYESVITKGRSADPNDPPLSISLKEALGKMDAQLKAAEFINQPAVLAKLDEDEKSGAFNAREYMEGVMQAVTGVKAKLTTDEKVIPAGASVLRVTRDAQGKEVSREIIQGNPKPTSGVRGIAADAADIDKLVEEGRLSEEEGQERIRALVAKKTTGTKAQGLAAGGGGGGKGGGGAGGGAGLSTAENRKLTRQQASLTSELSEYRDERKAINERFDNAKKDAKPDAPLGRSPKQEQEYKAEVARIEQERLAELAKLDSREADVKRKKKEIDQRLDLGYDAEAGASAPAAPTKKGIAAGPKLTKDQAAKVFGF